MKKVLAVICVLAMVIGLTACGGGGGSSQPAVEKWEPSQPITIMNHVAAGGAMDLYSRKWVELAAKYTDATFVVDNNDGASGLTAGEWVLGQEADGYTIFALAPTYIDAVIQGELDCSEYVDGFVYVYNLMADPYCVLVPTAPEGGNPTYDTFAELVEWAKQDGNNLTLSEPNYGAKYIDAVQVFNEVGVDFQAISYGGAKKNFAALLGGQAIASVGNPGDTAKYAVKALVVGSQGRLAGMPDVPTYEELGYDKALDGIWMWRGYAVKAGTPEGMINWFQDLCDQISADPEWIEYMESQLIAVRTDRTADFTKIVEDEVTSTIEVLKSVDQISADYKR
ncbi:MAG: tripartite tricarboxylate transporter substrate binding protein [Firmicutes bacterium]|nr:tripartite tricarboxylate transporter substrate binding protein [Bacillota bacterium]